MAKTNHRSVSQINTYTSCPRKYRFAYVDEGIEIMTDNSDKTLGQAIHKAQEFNYIQKIKSKKDLPLEEIDNFMREFLINEFKNNESNTEFFKVKYGKQVTPESLIAQASGMLEVLYKEVMVNTQPLYVEMPITLNMFGQEFLLFIDLIDSDWKVRDLKTSASKYQDTAIERNTQLIAYALAFRKKFGKKESAVQLDVITKTKTPQVQQLSTVVTDADIARFLDTLEQVNKAIEHSIFPPVDNPMTCSWCDFKELCAEDNGLPDAKILAEKLKKITEIKK